MTATLLPPRLEAAADAITKARIQEYLRREKAMREFIETVMFWNQWTAILGTAAKHICQCHGTSHRNRASKSACERWNLKKEAA